MVWSTARMPMSRVTRVGFAAVAVMVAEFSVLFTSVCVPCTVNDVVPDPLSVAAPLAVAATVPLVVLTVALTVSPLVYFVACAVPNPRLVAVFTVAVEVSACDHDNALPCGVRGMFRETVEVVEVCVPVTWYVNESEPVDEEFCAYENAPVALLMVRLPLVGADVMENVVVGEVPVVSVPCK